MNRLWLVALVVSIVGFATLGSGCVYYNLYYNINRIYHEAEKDKRGPDGKATRQTRDKYDKVIRKCQQLIVQHPDSKYVDDAVLLIGKSYYEKGEYPLAITKFEELAENFPESKLNEEGQLYLAKSHIEMDRPASAVSILATLYEAKPRSKLADEMLYYLGVSLIRIGSPDDAAEYLKTLGDRFPNSPLRLEADLEMADLFAERGDYDSALALYIKLANARIDTENRIRYLHKLAEVYVGMGEYDKALDELNRLKGFALDNEMTAARMLLEAEANAGKGALDEAIDSYESIAARFPRSKVAAEAYFRLGDIYQTTLDSLDLAKKKFDEVPRQYANSPYAKDAVIRSVSIMRFQRLQASLAAGETVDEALVQFELAETELFQFNNTEKALAGYTGILNDHGDSEVAPKAAYAIAYIYEKVLNDETGAQRAYLRLLREYPSSQQAGFARAYLGITPELLEESRSDSSDNP